MIPAPSGIFAYLVNEKGADGYERVVAFDYNGTALILDCARGKLMAAIDHRDEFKGLIHDQFEGWWPRDADGDDFA